VVIVKDRVIREIIIRYGVVNIFTTRGGVNITVTLVKVMTSLIMAVRTLATNFGTNAGVNITSEGKGMSAARGTSWGIVSKGMKLSKRESNFFVF